MRMTIITIHVIKRVLQKLKPDADSSPKKDKKLRSLLIPESVTPLRHSTKALDSTAVKKYPLTDR